MNEIVHKHGWSRKGLFVFIEIIVWISCFTEIYNEKRLGSHWNITWQWVYFLFSCVYLTNWVCVHARVCVFSKAIIQWKSKQTNSRTYTHVTHFTENCSRSLSGYPWNNRATYHQTFRIILYTLGVNFVPQCLDVHQNNTPTNTRSIKQELWLQSN